MVRSLLPWPGIRSLISSNAATRASASAAPIIRCVTNRTVEGGRDDAAIPRASSSAATSPALMPHAAVSIMTKLVSAGLTTRPGSVASLAARFRACS